MPGWDMGLRACSNFPEPFHTGAQPESQILNEPEKQIKENPAEEGQGHTNGLTLPTRCLFNRNLAVKADEGAGWGRLNTSHHLHSP